MGGCPCKKTEKNQNNNINNDNTTRNAILNNQMEPIFVERQYNYQNNPYNNNYKKQCTCGYYKNNYINQNRNIIKQYEINKIGTRMIFIKIQIEISNKKIIILN